MDLIITTVDLPKKYTTMINEIYNFMPEYSERVANFGKRQSQFMDNMLTVSHATPLRNARQILSEITRSIDALKESYFTKEETKLDIEDAYLLDTKRGNLEGRKLQSSLETNELYIAGAVRKINNLILTYKEILKKAGKEEFSEEDFEKEEEKYHIMKSFEQGICAARSHGGVVDEGNQIYFHQIGINGTVALRHVQNYLAMESKLLEEGKEPTHGATLDFLEAMYERYKGSAQVYADWKGMPELINTSAMISHDDKEKIEE